MRASGKRILKWLAWITGGFMLLVVLFLTIPGIKCDWRYPTKAKPWIVLLRADYPGFRDLRQVAVGEMRLGLMTTAATHTIPATWLGSHWDQGNFTYFGEHWMITAGAKSKRWWPEDSP